MSDAIAEARSGDDAVEKAKAILPYRDIVAAEEKVTARYICAAYAKGQLNALRETREDFRRLIGR